MLLCFLIKFCHVYPRFSVVSHGEKDKKLCELPLQRYLQQRCVLHLCTQICSRSSLIWLIYLHFREFILSSFLFLLLLTAVNPASIQCSLLYIGTKVSIQETEQVKIKIKNRERKEEDQRENKLN